MLQRPKTPYDIEQVVHERVRSCTLEVKPLLHVTKPCLQPTQELPYVHSRLC